DQGRTYLPRHNKGRHIPGNYSGSDSKRFLHGKSISALVDRDKISVETARKPAIIFKDICKTFYLVFSFGKRFSLLPGEQDGKFILSFSYNSRSPVKYSSSLLRGCGSPITKG